MNVISYFIDEVMKLKSAISVLDLRDSNCCSSRANFKLKKRINANIIKILEQTIIAGVATAALVIVAGVTEAVPYPDQLIVIAVSTLILGCKNPKYAANSGAKVKVPWEDVADPADNPARPEGLEPRITHLTPN